MVEPGSDRPAISIAFRFADFDEAGRAYERARDLIFGADLNASAYRVVLNGVAHVVVVGEDVPYPRLQQALPEICQKGELIDVPDEVVLALALRRAQFDGPDVKFERRSAGGAS
jgi:hypothetical protein